MIILLVRIFYIEKERTNVQTYDLSRFSSFHDREERISGVIIKLKIFEGSGGGGRGGAHYHDIPFASAGWNADGNDLLCFTLMTAPFLFFYVGSTSSSLFSL